MQSRLWSSTHKKQLGICIKYTYITELMIWLHQSKFVNIKWVKIPSLAALQVAKYMKTVKQCVEKNYFAIFWAEIFLRPKAVTDVKTACIRAGVCMYLLPILTHHSYTEFQTNSTILGHNRCYFDLWFDYHFSQYQI